MRMKKFVFISLFLVFVCTVSSQEKKKVKLKIVEPKEQASKLSESAMLYPNPVMDVINVSLPQNENGVVISLFDSQGKLLEKTSVDDGLSIYQISLADYQSGSYLIQVTSAQKTNTYMVIKK